jgi:cell wall-associated NlpC family hydrolase
LVRQVYRQYAGFDLPHDTKKLYKLVSQVDLEDIAYGDLVFFSDGWFSVSHVGIYVGNGSFVHSSETRGVMISSLDEEHFRKRYRGARRVIP